MTPKTISASCSDDVLSAAFSEHIAGFHASFKPWGYATSSSLVIPLLEKWVAEDRNYRQASIHLNNGRVCVDLRGCVNGPIIHHGDTIARCVCFCLLKANGWTVEG